jgi:hypothetical protein
MRDESSQIVRLSTRDVAPADSLSYASWILDSAQSQENRGPRGTQHPFADSAACYFLQGV